MPSYVRAGIRKCARIRALSNALFVSHDFDFKAENQVVRQHLIKKYPLTIIFR